MTVWPSLSCRFFATRRATTSVPPPAGNGTMKRIVFCGQVCASDGAAVTHSRAAVAASILPIFIDVSLPVRTVWTVCLPSSYPKGAALPSFRLCVVKPQRLQGRLDLALAAGGQRPVRQPRSADRAAHDLPHRLGG